MLVFWTYVSPHHFPVLALYHHTSFITWVKQCITCIILPGLLSNTTSELTTPSSPVPLDKQNIISILMLMKILQPQTKIQTEVVDTCLMFNSIIQQLPSRRGYQNPQQSKSYWPNKRIICRKTNRTYWVGRGRKHILCFSTAIKSNNFCKPCKNKDTRQKQQNFLIPEWKHDNLPCG